MYSRVQLTGVVRYQPEKCWNGLTLIPAIPGSSTAKGAALYDMNGNTVHRWPGVFGAFDNKLLPGGHILGTTAYSKGYWLDCQNLSQLDWNGKVEWAFTKGEYLPDLDGGQPFMSARQHHDYQREGSPVGYYCPGQEPLLRGKTLINSTVTRDLPEFSAHKVADTRILEVDPEGNILWSWSLFDHWDQLGIEAIGKTIHYHSAPCFGKSDQVKATYCNNINYVGPNPWFDAGDQRFHPDNIISDIRLLNTSFIIDRATGNIVWRIGPNFTENKALQDIGQIVGQHHVHIIPQGLPGQGNVLLFDNGGQAGLGAPTPSSPLGYCNATRGYSRVLEINPQSLQVVWAFNDLHFNYKNNMEDHLFSCLLYSPFCSSADRLPNGNTLITELLNSRVLEVTPECEIVWEFINPGAKVFRAHRYPYSWCPEVKTPQHTPVQPLPNYRIHISPDGKPVLMDEDNFFVKDGESILD